MATNSVETLKIKDLSVTVGKLAGGITAIKLATDSVETIKIKDANVTLAKLAPDAMGDFGHKLLHIQDQKGTGTAGGTFTAGAWRTRDLNTVLTNEIPSATLVSNQISLPAGTYFIIASAPAFRTNNHKAKLRNITDGADILIGLSEFSTTTGDQAMTPSRVIGRFTIAGTKVLELQHQSAMTQALNGFGAFAGFAVIEVYSDVAIWKV